MPCNSAMCTLRYDAATVTPHYVQLTHILFLSIKAAPSPVARHLYAVYPHFSQINLSIHTTTLVFLRLASIPILRNIATVTINASWTHS